MPPFDNSNFNFFCSPLTVQSSVTEGQSFNCLDYLGMEHIRHIKRSHLLAG